MVFRPAGHDAPDTLVNRPPQDRIVAFRSPGGKKHLGASRTEQRRNLPAGGLDHNLGVAPGRMGGRGVGKGIVEHLPHGEDHFRQGAGGGGIVQINGLRALVGFVHDRCKNVSERQSSGISSGLHKNFVFLFVFSRSIYNFALSVQDPALAGFAHGKRKARPTFRAQARH